MSHWLQNQIDRAVSGAFCPDCKQSACKCYNRAFWSAKGERERLELEERSIVNEIRTAHPAFPVLLQRAAVSVSKGLEIEGVATTRLWDEGQHYPLAAGLKRLDGSTIGYGVGRVMRKMERTLPVPLLWQHEKDKPLGWMFEARATVDKLYFVARIVPPGTPNYDSGLLERVRKDIRDRAVGSVSFTAHTRSNGAWTPIELSVCPEGANPCAVITRASFPDGETIYREEVPFDEERIRTANAKHHQSRDAQLRSGAPLIETRALGEELRAVVREEVARWGGDLYRGLWGAGESYLKGQMVSFNGGMWCRQSDGSHGMPGESSDWKLAVKRGRDGRDRK